MITNNVITNRIIIGIMLLLCLILMRRYPILFIPKTWGICCINGIVLFCNPYILENYACFFLLIRKTYLPLQRFRSGQRLTECGIDYIL